MSEIDDLKAEISQLKNDIALKVNADNVVTAINSSPEGIRIKGDKIFIDSETLIENGVISIDIGSKDRPDGVLMIDGKVIDKLNS